MQEGDTIKIGIMICDRESLGTWTPPDCRECMDNLLADEKTRLEYD